MNSINGKIRLILCLTIVGLIFNSCGDGPTSPSATDQTQGPATENSDSGALNDNGTESPAVGEPITITYNLHESLPTAWIEEFTGIMTDLLALLPLSTTNFNTVTVYSWNDKSPQPYSGVSGGAYIGGSSQTDLWMVLEIPNAEFEHEHLHRYSVIAHEYFHLYQLSVHSSMSDGTFNIKWLSEGTAAAFESVYTDQYFSPSDQTYFDAQTSVEFLTDGDPAALESYSSNNVDANYSASVFLVLTLVKELMRSGLSEEDAFKRVLMEFPAQNPSNENWKAVFASQFGFSVDDFYNVVKTSSDYRLTPVTVGVDVNKVRPNRALTVQSIFD